MRLIHKISRYLVLLLFAASQFLLFFNYASAQYGTFLHYIKVDFFDCDDPSNRSSKLYWELEEQESRDICYEVKNTFNKPLDVVVHFVDGGLSSSSRVCHSATRKYLFGAYVDENKKQLTIGASESIKGKSTIQFPQGYVGQVMGCLMYNVVDEQSGGMFEIIVGRTKFIDVFVKGDLVLDLQFSAPKHDESLVNHEILNVRKMQKDEISISMMIENKGNVAQDIVLKGSLKPIFGEAIEFTPQLHNIQGQQKIETTFHAEIPWYKGPFAIDIYAEHTANFLFDNDQISSDMRETQSKSFQTSFFLFPRWLVLLLVFVVLIIRMLIILSKKHKRKKQQQIQQMQQMYQQMYQPQVANATYPGGFLQNQQGYVAPQTTQQQYTQGGNATQPNQHPQQFAGQQTQSQPQVVQASVNQGVPQPTTQPQQPQTVQQSPKINNNRTPMPPNQ